MADMSPEASRRRRMVYHGIRPVLSEEQARRAVILCDEEFPPPGVFSVQKFLERFCEIDPASKAAKGQIFKAMILLRPLGGDAIGPDPLTPKESRAEAKSSGSISRSTTPAKGVTGWTIIFDAMFQELLYQFMSRNRELLTRLKLHLQSVLPKSKLSLPAMDQFKAWFLNPTGYQYRDGLSQTEMHTILHEVYLWSCEQVGPIDTDRIFAKAISEAEKQPEAMTYLPRGLL